MSDVTSKQRGFTLIEVMCATGILVVGMMGVYSAEIASARNYAHSRKVFAATSFASNMVEMLKMMRPSEVQALQGGYRRNYDVNGQVMQGVKKVGFYQLKIRPSPGNGAQAFTVQVTWPDDTQPGKEGILQMSGAPL